MEQVVVDASVAIKWVCSEDLSPNAQRVRDRYSLVAPDLILAECANILWKKVRLGQLDEEEAILSAGVLGRAGIDLVPVAQLCLGAVRLAVELDHPAYDCFYLELCQVRGLHMITADDRLVRKLAQTNPAAAALAIALGDIR